MPATLGSASPKADEALRLQLSGLVTMFAPGGPEAASPFSPESKCNPERTDAHTTHLKVCETRVELNKLISEAA